MAEALVVQFLLDNLKQLLIYNADLFLNVNDQVDGLVRDLGMLKAFAEDAAKKPSNPATVNELLKAIRLKTYQAEDAIDLYVVEATIQKTRNTARKMFHGIDHTFKIRNVALEVNGVRTQVKEIYDNKLFGFEALKLADADGSNSKDKMAPVVEEENVVGFDEEANKLIGRLIGGPVDLQVISIVGMGGLGKTTLAHKIYTDRRVTFEFSTRAWSYVSQNYKRKDVLLDILSGLVPQVTNENRSMTDTELIAAVRKNLSWKYLVVVDDVWAPEDWENLKAAFPDNKKGSRILLTSRNREPALRASPDPGNPPHDLKFLTEDESWELLRIKVFGRGTCPPSDLGTIGKQIAKDCKGLPLTIVVVAGMLLGKPKQSWINLASSVSQYIVTGPKKLMEVLALSYNDMPHHLKACFLYFGAFPVGFKIPVQKLIRLWIAEGFVQKFGDVCLENRAEDILEELVGRNLVMVSQRSLLGQIKTCHIHDVLRDLCLAKAEEENFYWEIKMPHEDETATAPTVGNTYRRLCIHSRILDFIASKPYGALVRSFLCFNSSEENQELPREHIPHIPQGFKLLRVFDSQPISFSIFPSKLKELVLLRYVAISGNFTVLPAVVSSLWNLQTLIVETTERTIDIQADIWKMVHLRHVHTTGASKLSGPPTTSTIPILGKKRESRPSVSSNNNLQTLSTILPESCTEKVLSRIPNIKKLGIRGKLSILLEGRQGSSTSFDLAKFHKLEKLKLWNDVSPDPPSKGKLSGLPRSYGFLPTLKKLTLQDTYLDWTHMSVLEMLPELEVLKLKECAFMGKVWNIPCERGFLQLKVLHIGKTDLEEWKATPLHFPKIQRIVIKECKSLTVIPSGLGEVPTLQMIELHHASASAVASAKEIKRQQQTRDIQVDIYPPEHNTSAS